MVKNRRFYVLLFIVFAFCAFLPVKGVLAKDENNVEKLKKAEFFFRAEKTTMYKGDINGSLLVDLVDSSMLDNEANIELGTLLNSEEFRKAKVFTSSNPKVICFMDYKDGTAKEVGKLTETMGTPVVKAVGSGSSTVTLKYPALNKSIKCKITVKEAGLYTDSVKFYTDNAYTFELKGKGITPVSFKSSDKTVAKVSKKGKVTAIKNGTVTISCKASNGKTYKKKIKIANAGINQSKIIIYSDGLLHENEKNYPLVVYGGDVKKWKTSDKKVATVEELKIDEHVSIGYVKYKGEGNCTITATTKDGRSFKCKVKAVKWSTGTAQNSSGVRVTTLKNSYSKYFKSIYKKQDYGNVIVLSALKSGSDLYNGNDPVSIGNAECRKLMTELNNRYISGLSDQVTCDTALVTLPALDHTDSLYTLVVYIKKNGYN